MHSDSYPTSDLARVFGPDLVALLDAYVDARVERALEARETERRWLTVPEAADYLGTTVKGIEARVARGTIPSVRHNGRRMIDRRRLDAQLEDHPFG